MLRRFVPFLGSMAFALAAIVIVAQPVAAQQHGHRQGSNYGNSRWNGDRGGYYGGRNWYGGNYGLGLTIGGYNPYYAPYYGSRYTSDVYGYDANNYRYAPSNAYRDDGRMSMYPPEDGSVVTISVKVSPNAEVWFDGAKTTQTDSLRQFTSPPINTDGAYTYQIRARWTEGGREVDQTRKVSFHAGDRLTVNFTTPQAQSNEVIGKPAELLPTVREQQPAAPVVREEAPRQPPVPSAKDADKMTHDGTVVSIAEDKLVMSGIGDSDHSHALNADVKWTCDGKVCKREDIKTGMKIRVTTKKNDQQTVTRVESLNKNDDFEIRN